MTKIREFLERLNLTNHRRPKQVRAHQENTALLFALSGVGEDTGTLFSLSEEKWQHDLPPHAYP